MILIMKKLNFLFQKTIIAKLQEKTIFALIYFVIKMDCKYKNQKYFCKCCLQCFRSEKVLIKHQENCLIINGKQSVKLKSESVTFKN